MKIAHLAVSKSGSNILRDEMGWQGKERIRIGSEEDQLTQLGGMMARGDGTVMGHLHYAEKIAEMLDDYFIIFQYRDPRDTIISRHYWLNEIHGNYTWEQSIRLTVDNMVKMEPWFGHCGLAISYEHLIKKEYPHTHTFRKGIVGDWKTEFPDNMWDLYNDLCESVKYWEYE